MPNGKPGDHPLTDIFVHGLHPFPADVEEMIRELRSIDPDLLKGIEDKILVWEVDKEFGKARKNLRELLQKSKQTSE